MYWAKLLNYTLLRRDYPFNKTFDDYHRHKSKGQSYRDVSDLVISRLLDCACGGDTSNETLDLSSRGLGAKGEIAELMGFGEVNGGFTLDRRDGLTGERGKGDIGLKVLTTAPGEFLGLSFSATFLLS